MCCENNLYIFCSFLLSELEVASFPIGIIFQKSMRLGQTQIVWNKLEGKRILPWPDPVCRGWKSQFTEWAEPVGCKQKMALFYLLSLFSNILS
jgi:hypothetical protein